jgi:urease beta subunit
MEIDGGTLLVKISALSKTLQVSPCKRSQDLSIAITMGSKWYFAEKNAVKKFSREKNGVR